MRKSDCLQTLAAVLMFGYRKNTDPVLAKSLVETLQTDWRTVRQVAETNRVWSNLIAVLFESRVLNAQLTRGEQTSTKRVYFGQLARADLLKKQLTQISEQLAASEHPPLLLLKGAAQVFAPLYPTPAHRYMQDLDVLYTDAGVLDGFCTLGYKTLSTANRPLEAITPAFIADHQRRFHHLPSLVHPDFKARVELHHVATPLALQALLPADVNALDNPVNTAPKLHLPSPLNQVIITLLHCIYAEESTHYINYRLRGILDAYLQYQTLSPAEAAALDAHFDSIGKSEDLTFWKYLCARLLDAPEFHAITGVKLQARYQHFIGLNQSETFHAFGYSASFLYRLITFGLWDKVERKRLLTNLTDRKGRSVFFNKIKTVFGRN